MSNKVSYQNHPKNPAAQPFVGRGSKCKAKSRSWWNPASPTYWRGKKG